MSMARPPCDTPLVSLPNRTSRSKTMSSTNWITETTDWLTILNMLRKMIVSTIVIEKHGSLFIEGVEIEHGGKVWRYHDVEWSSNHIACVYRMLGSNILCEMVVLLVLFQYLFFPWGENLHAHTCNCNTKMGY